MSLISIYGDSVFDIFCSFPYDPTNTDTSTTSTNTPNKKLVGYMDRLNEILKNLTNTYNKKVALERIALLKAEAYITFRTIK